MPCRPHSPVESVLIQEQNKIPMQYSVDPIHIERHLTDILLTSSEHKILLSSLADSLGKILQVDVCLIAAIANHDSIIETAYWSVYKQSASLYNKRTLLLKHPVLKDILNKTEPLLIPKDHNVEIWNSLGCHPELIANTAVIGISIKFQGESKGIILLGQSRPEVWSVSEIELFKIVSQQVAIAMSQIQLQNQVYTGLQYQNILNQLSDAIRHGWELEKILQLSISMTAQTLLVEQGLILLLKYADPRFKSVSSQGFPKVKITVAAQWQSKDQELETSLKNPENSNNKQLLTEPFWLSDSYLCQQAFLNAPQPLIINDQTNSQIKESENKNDAIFDSVAMPAVMMIPLENQGTILGFFVLQHSQPRPWQGEELVLISWISAQISTAIIQNQTLRQVQALVEERTAQLQRSLEVQAKLFEKTRQQVDQLRHLNQIKDEFIDTVSHELKTPLASMKLAICNLRRQPEPPPERRAKYLEILEAQCTQEINLIKDLLALQRLESRQLPIQLETIDLKLLINDLAESFTEKWADKGLTLAIDLPEPSLIIETDHESLNRIILELLNNAGKYADPDTTVKLNITVYENNSDHQIILTLANQCPGISPTEQAYIFDKFRRGEGVTQQAIQGTGLGLALVKSLVQHLNGTISLSNSPMENSQSYEVAFILTLPQIFDHKIANG